MKRRTVAAMSRRIQKHIRDTSEASAALLFRSIPDWAALPDAERHARLRATVAATLVAFCESAPRPTLTN